jgi:HSP20 family protein
MDGNTHVWHITRTPAWRPPTDVYELEEAFVVRVEVAGMREDDFSIHIEGSLLVVRGVRMDTTERRAYHQMEIPFGEFILEVELTAAISTGEIEAGYKDGFLRIYLPKARPKTIIIEEN